jgi:argininosuccinate lyase
MKPKQPISRSGRFAAGPHPIVADFTESVSFDYRLWREDIQGSLAHATMLNRVGLLSRRELAEIRTAMAAIARDIEAGRFRWRRELEDVHMHIEAELTRRTLAGAKLHTGRSRNDQVALDLRLWLRGQASELDSELRTLQRALVALADRYRDVVIPGYTHLQRAQPVLFAHHCLAYVEMLHRDRQRLSECRQRLNVCPLGSGALAGSPLPLDRAFVALLLAFVDARGRPRLTQNSMDAVSDRDFAVEFCALAALVAVHLSRLAEDLVLWTTREFGFVRMGDAFTTGSSLMPQKRNPDVAELVRGKSARVIGNLVALLTLIKGLPLTYNRDLQEDKERLFDTVDVVRASTRVLAAMLRHTRVNRATCAAAAADPALLATDLADYLVRGGVPFREAHHAVGKLVASAERAATSLEDLPFAQYREAHPRFRRDVYALFQLDRALSRRQAVGSPGPAAVATQLRRWKRLLTPPTRA